MRTTTLGVLSGLVALALLFVPARTPAFAIAALVVPVIGGAVAATLASRRAGRELGVDEAAGIGARVGLTGGVVVAARLHAR